MRNALTWVLTAPLLVVGLLAGHSLGYRLAYPDAHDRAHVLDTSGHSYLAFAPIAISVGLTLVLAAFVACVRRVRSERRSVSPPWFFALLPLPAFLLQEYAERALHSDVAWTTALDPAVVTGLLLQIPIALIALVVARALTRLAEVVARALGQASHARIADLLSCSWIAVEPLPLRGAGRGWSERGPPARPS